MESIKLKEHNKETYCKVLELFKTEKKVAVEQATSTGKSYIIAKLSESDSFKKVLFMSSSKLILKQFKDEFYYIPKMLDKIDFMTYSKLIYESEEDFEKLKYDLIILDEYHRLGARVWGKKVDELLNLNPDAFVLGTTATATRYLDGYTNMTDKLFNGVLANKITLPDALQRGILVKPKYIIGIYDIRERLLSLDKEIINQNKEKRELLLKKLSFVSSNFKKVSGIKPVLRKYITNERKFIIFCQNKEHLLQMRTVITEIFKDIYNEKVNTYSIFTGNIESNHNSFEDFKLGSTDEFHLLFVIDMLNEGVHIPVQGIIMLRNTLSPTIYFQQLGRVLSMNKDTVPLVFDFVNNNKYISVSYNLFSNQSNDYKKSIEEIDKKDLDFFNGVFDVYDESIEINHVLEEIEFNLEQWEDYYNELVKFKAEHNHCNVPPSNTKLYRWCMKQRELKKHGRLTGKRYRLLQELGFPWNLLDYKWFRMYEKLKEFSKVNGHCNVSSRYIDKELAQWVKTQRKNRLIISEDRRKLLYKIGFKFEVSQESNCNRWMKMFNELKKFKDLNNHCNVSSRHTNRQLSNWVRTQRRTYAKGKLSKEREAMLRSIGFDFLEN